MNSIEFVFAMSMSQKETASLSIRLYSSSLSRHSSSRHAFSPLDLDDLHDKTVSSKSNARLIMIFGYVVWRSQKTDVHVESQVVFAKHHNWASWLKIRGPGQDLPQEYGLRSPLDYIYKTRSHDLIMSLWGSSHKFTTEIMRHTSINRLNLRVRSVQQIKAIHATRPTQRK